MKFLSLLALVIFATLPTRGLLAQGNQLKASPILFTPVGLNAPVNLNAPVAVEAVEAVEANNFYESVTAAIERAVKASEITGVEGDYLNFAFLAPAFRKRAEDLAVIQMAFSDDAGFLTRDASGKIDRASIDWVLISETFVQKFLPIYLQLLDQSGV